MECERLTKLIKSWYIQVKDEALAPARMADFMRAHLAGCPVCQNDSAVESEVKKIIEIIMPAAKIPKVVQQDDEEDFEDEDVSSEESGDEQNEDDDQAEGELDDEEEEIDEIEDEDDDI